MIHLLHIKELILFLLCTNVSGNRFLSPMLREFSVVSSRLITTLKNSK
jgi:hypothetical protein